VISPVHIRDLKGDEMSDDAALVNTALQGPRSRQILCDLLGSDHERDRLNRLQRTRFMETIIERMEVMISRTGYTGEEVGYEILMHPADAVVLWKLLLDAGAKFGLKPVGLGARDSLRIEAGLPLHGSELAGQFNISPIEAGFGPYVKFHKSFFVGRNELLRAMHANHETNARHAASVSHTSHTSYGFNRAVVRFRMLTRGARIAKSGDPVISGRTQRMIGRVTSCAVDAEGVQIGMACVDRQYAREEVKIGIVPLSSGSRTTLKSVTELAAGDRFPLPVEAVILSRFPEKRRMGPA
jgi:glycine hydroxymethyltransferase